MTKENKQPKEARLSKGEQQYIRNIEDNAGETKRENETERAYLERLVESYGADHTGANMKLKHQPASTTVPGDLLYFERAVVAVYEVKPRPGNRFSFRTVFISGPDKGEKVKFKLRGTDPVIPFDAVLPE